MPLELPNDISSEVGTINNIALGQNFETIEGKFAAGIEAPDINDDAGIRKNQIADNCITYAIPLMLLPNRLASGGAAHTIDQAAFEFVGGVEIDLDASQKAWVCKIVARCGAVTGATYVRLEVRKNGTAIPGATFDLDTSNSRYFVERANPIINCLDTLEDEDYISCHIMETGAADPTIEWLEVTITIKVQLVRG